MLDKDSLQAVKIKLIFVSALVLFSYNTFLHAQSKRFIIILDAGHGGKDPGKVAKGIEEKDLALDFVLALGEELEKEKDIKVVYTRKSDVFVDLFKRGKIANKAHGDLFISIHCNAHSSQVNGSETYVLGLNTNRQNFEVAKTENKVIYLEDNYQKNYEGYDINSPESVIGITITQEEFLRQSVELASYIQNNFSENLNRYNRGVKQAGFIVLHQTFMPSVLIETGFITNRSERNFLLSKKGKNDIAHNIALAILEYKKIHGNTVENKNNIYYKIQIVASTQRIDLKPSNFKGLNDITIDKYDQYYRYYYRKTSDYQEAEKCNQIAIKKGYKDAYIVAYNGAERISVKEALKINN